MTVRTPYSTVQYGTTVVLTSSMLWYYSAVVVCYGISTPYCSMQWYAMVCYGTRYCGYPRGDLEPNQG